MIALAFGLAGARGGVDATGPRTPATATATGELAQLTGPPGCLMHPGPAVTGVCTGVPLVRSLSDVVVSPDGKHLYATGFRDGSVLAFRRDAATGQLFPLAGRAACTVNLVEHPDFYFCTGAVQLRGPESLAISPDGSNVYVASTGADAVLVFDRNAETGALRQKSGTAGCVKKEPSGPCGVGRGINEPVGVEVTPGVGRTVYVASRKSNAVAVFGRKFTGDRGGLATLGCWSATGSGGGCQNGRGLHEANAVTIAVGETRVFVSAAKDGVTFFRRHYQTGALTAPAGRDACINASGATCIGARVMKAPRAVLATRDARNLYVGTDEGIAVFTSGSASNAPVPLGGLDGCVGLGINCNVGAPAHALAESADGKTLYAASNRNGGGSRNGRGVLFAYARNATNGGLTRLAGPGGCFRAEIDPVPAYDPCGIIRWPPFSATYITSVAVSPDGRNVYASAGYGLLVFRRS
ncbi:MAG: hypothetical protein ABI717_02485 [Actinomycetota bacterium]